MSGLNTIQNYGHTEKSVIEWNRKTQETNTKEWEELIEALKKIKNKKAFGKDWLNGELFK